MSSVLVVDVGTSTTKAGIVDKKGNMISSYEVDNKIHQPFKGAAEHDPDEIIDNIIKAVKKTIENANGDIDIKYLVLSSYQLGLILLDENKQPITGLITLLDSRAQNSFESLVRDIDPEEVYKRTGCPLSHLYPFSKLLWMRKFKKDDFERARYILDSKAYILYRLTGRIVTEPSVASASQLFNISEKSWDDFILQKLGIEKSKLPEVIDGTEVVGHLEESVKESIGLKDDVDVIAGVYDGGGIILGLGGLEGGIGGINLGTTAMFRSVVSQPAFDENKVLQTYHFFDDLWLTGEGINNAGVVLRYLKDVLKYEDYHKMLERVKNIPVGSDGVIFLPYLTGERDPRIGSNASGAILGMKLHHKKEHIVRAALEGVAFTLRLVKEAMERNGIKIKEVRVGGGGARSKLWLEIISNVLGAPLKKAKSEHVSFIGEAMLGYVKMGVYRDLLEASREMVDFEYKLIPDEATSEKYRKSFNKFKNILRKLTDGIF